MANDPNWRLPDVPSFLVSSPDFSAGGTLPTSARGDAGGDNRSPALNWEGAPAGTKSYAVTAYDPDAPTGSGFWHWAIYNIPASVTSLAADAGNPDSGLLPPGARSLSNELGEARYAGAAPPSGHGEHRYFFTVTALDVETLDIPASSTPAVLGFNFLGHVLARAQVVGVATTP